MGGYLSVVYALKYPQYVEKLILASPAGVSVRPENPPSPGRGWVVDMFAKVWGWNITPMDILRTFGPFGSQFLRQYTAHRFAYLDEIDHQDFHEYVYHISAQKGSGEYALAALLHPGAWAKNPLCNRVHELQVPTTFLYGREDWMDYKGGLAAASRMKHVSASVLMIDKAGHHLYLDNHAVFNEVIKSEMMNQDSKKLESVEIIYRH